MVSEPSLPELTTALRALGSSRRRHAKGGEQERFFAPLLEARRAAARAGTALTAVEAFDAGRLRAALTHTMRSLAADRAAARRQPVRRALESRLVERVEPLAAALQVLGERAATWKAAAGDERDHAWREWANQLAAVFATADRCWLDLDATLDALPNPRPGLMRRLFRRRRA